MQKEEAVSQTEKVAIEIDLQMLNEAAKQGGPQWGCATEDLNLTVLSWPRDHRIAAHTNTEVDVVVVVLEGEGEVCVDAESHALKQGGILLIPKGAERSIKSNAERFTYLSIHRRRPGLMPVFK